MGNSRYDRRGEAELSKIEIRTESFLSVTPSRGRLFFFLKMTILVFFCVKIKFHDVIRSYKKVIYHSYNSSCTASEEEIVVLHRFKFEKKNMLVSQFFSWEYELPQ